MSDLTEMFQTMRGNQFIDAVRALALISDAQGRSVVCAGCRKPAEYIGMQRCGAPGGPLCAECVDRHRQWIATASALDAEPYCRHCDEDIDSSHIYVVGLWDGLEYPL